MDQAGAGDTVEIAPGTYGEALVLDKALTLRGGGASASDVVIDGSSGSSVTAADGGGEVLQISIHGLRLTSTFYPAITVDGADVTVAGSIVSGETQSAGMRLFRGSVLIDDSVFSDKTNAILVGYSVSTPDPGTAELIVRDSLITNNQNGAIQDFHPNSSVTVMNSVIENTSYGPG